MGIRQDGITFLKKYLGHRPAGHIARSRFYTPDVAWPKCCCWWHDIPLDKLQKVKGLKVHLLCRKRNGRGFHYLCVPVSFFKRKLELLCVVRAAPKNREVIRLHLSAEKRDLFHDLRGDGTVDFSKFQEC